MTEPEYKDMIEKYGHIPLPVLNEEYAKALIEKYGHIPELNHMVAVDEDRPTEEQLRAENRAMQDIPDDELDDEEYYGRHGYSRTAPTCDDPECFMCD